MRILPYWTSPQISCKIRGLGRKPQIGGKTRRETLPKLQPRAGRGRAETSQACNFSPYWLNPRPSESTGRAEQDPPVSLPLFYPHDRLSYLHCPRACKGPRFFKRVLNRKSGPGRTISASLRLVRRQYSLADEVCSRRVRGTKRHSRVVALERLRNGSCADGRQKQYNKNCRCGPQGTRRQFLCRGEQLCMNPHERKADH